MTAGSTPTVADAIGTALAQLGVRCVFGVVGSGNFHVTNALTGAGAVTRLLGSRLGTITCAEGEALEVDATLENSPSVPFDALVLPDGEKAVALLPSDSKDRTAFDDRLALYRANRPYRLEPKARAREKAD